MLWPKSKLLLCVCIAAVAYYVRLRNTRKWHTCWALCFCMLAQILRTLSNEIEKNRRQKRCVCVRRRASIYWTKLMNLQFVIWCAITLSAVAAYRMRLYSIIYLCNHFRIVSFITAKVDCRMYICRRFCSCTMLMHKTNRLLSYFWSIWLLRLPRSNGRRWNLHMLNFSECSHLNRSIRSPHTFKIRRHDCSMHERDFDIQYFS